MDASKIKESGCAALHPTRTNLAGITQSDELSDCQRRFLDLPHHRRHNHPLRLHELSCVLFHQFLAHAAHLPLMLVFALLESALVVSALHSELSELFRAAALQHLSVLRVKQLQLRL